MSSLLRVSLFATLTVTLSAACGGEHDHTHATPDADTALPDAAPMVEEFTVTLEPGQLIEGILAGGPEDRAVIEATASSPTLDWNIHGHADGSTQTVVEELDVQQVSFEFVPSAQADWYLLLRAGGAEALDVTVRLELHGGMTWTAE
jgi:hypothetical protein